MTVKQVSNPPNPWAESHVEWLGEPPEVELNVYEETAASALSTNESPDLPFSYSVNPYRGCYHGCAYCYARRTHEYLAMGAGTDFERRIVVKVNAAEALREEIVHRDWSREPINFSGVTDPYQPLEASYEVTRECLEICADIDNPVCIVTKGALVQRDAELLGDLASRAPVRVYVSIPFAEDEAGRALEPHATTISQRLETLRTLSEAGVTTGVGIAPIMPGLNDADIPTILERAADAGAVHAFTTLLRLPGSVEPVFIERLREAYPDRADRVLNGVREMRGGELNSNEFGERMTGKGPRWNAITTLFRTQCRRLGLNESDRAEVDTVESPGDIQPSLF